MPDRPQTLSSWISDPVTVGNITGHLTSLGAIVMVFTGLLPALAAGGALIWYSIAIWESKTVQGIVRRHRERRHRRHADRANRRAAAAARRYAARKMQDLQPPGV